MASFRKYQELYEEQNGHCGICGKESEEDELILEYDKKREPIALLCSDCMKIMKGCHHNLRTLAQATDFVDCFWK